MVLGLDTLPPETIDQILHYLDDPCDLAAFSQCDWRCYEIVSESKVWSRSLVNSWRYSNESTCFPFKNEFDQASRPMLNSSEAKAKFRSRRMQDLRIAKCIMTIVESPQGRLKYVDAISDSFMDAADAVRNFRLRHGRIKHNYGIDYYCCLLEKHLSRKLGIHLLQKVGSQIELLGNGPHDGFAPLVALFGIGCFHKTDGLDLHLQSILDELQRSVLESHTPESWAALPLSTDSMSSQSKIGSIMAALNDAGIRSADSEDYYDLRNSFLYCVLKEQRPTIPITMVAIFVALCSRLDLKCHPIGFPGQVLAIVELGDEQVFIAPYENGRIYGRTELVERLQSYGLPDIEQYLRSCSVQELCRRSAKNILNCIERGSGESTLEGLYAALVTIKLMGERLPLAEEQFITLVCLHFPYDINIWERLDMPEYQEAIRRNRLEDVTVRKPKLRAEQSLTIRHRVGTIFRHALFNYVAM